MAASVLAATPTTDAAARRLRDDGHAAVPIGDAPEPPPVPTDRA